MTVPPYGYGDGTVIHQEEPILTKSTKNLLIVIVFGAFMLWIGMLIESKRYDPPPYKVHDTETVSIVTSQSQ